MVLSNLSEMMVMTGFILSFFYNIPQIWKIHKIKDVEAISIISYVVCIIGQFCFGFRFWYISEWPAFATSIFNIITCLIVLFQYRIYKK